MQENFERDGYVVFDLLTGDDVRRLKEYYFSMIPAEVPSYGFHVSLDHANREQVLETTRELKRVMEPRVAEILHDFQIFTASYVIKETNPKGVVPPHQDWTFVDESEYWSATLWTPLVDVDMDNGALGVIKGSHRFFDWQRCSPSPQFKTPLGEHMFTIFPYLDVIPLKAGQAMMFDNRTIHGSPPNTTETARLAAGIGVTHREASLFHHYLLPNTSPERIRTFSISPDFFMQYNNGSLSDLHNNGGSPEGWEILGEYDLDLPKFSGEEMQVRIKKHPGNAVNGPLIEKMARLFNYNLDGTKKEEPKPEPEVAEVTVQPAAEKRGFWSRIFSGGK